MSRFNLCDCPAGFNAAPERHAPDCPGRSGAGKPRVAAIQEIPDGDQPRKEFEAWVLSEYPNQRMSKFADGEYHSTTIQYCWLAWQAARLPSGVVSATAWRVIDAKGKRFTVYNKDLAIAIADAGLCVAPMCDVPREGWECSRRSGHEGPCAAFEVAP